MSQRKFSKLDISNIRSKSRSTETFGSVTFVGKTRPKKRQWNFSKVGSFAAAGIIMVLVLQGLMYLSSAGKAKGEILGEATSAYTELHSASKDLAASNFSSATGLFASAENNIRIAQEKLSGYSALKWLTPQGSSTDHLLSGASLLSQAGQKLSTALSLFDELKVSSKGVVTSDFNQKISTNHDLLSQSQSLVLQAGREFDQVGAVPLDYQETLSQAKQQVSDLNLILEKLVGLEDLYINFFSGQKTYLMVFQNPDEIRATGGFIGTYGILKTADGSIKSLQIESIYNLDGQIFEQIAAPGPLQPAIKKWGIRDANWFADFPTSAQKLLHFLELGKETADGVLSVTPQMFEDLLKLTGPIQMPDYGVTLTADNFQQLVQFKTSVDYDAQMNQPKKFLADFAQILLNRLIDLKQDQWFGVFQAAENNLLSKQILLYSKDPSTEKKIQDLGFDGRVLPTNDDYLSIINTNLGGTKTDLSIDQSINYKSKILSDGSVINTLTINRSSKADANNKDYLRVLVPSGSSLISSTGFDLYDYHPSAAPGFVSDPDLASWDQGRMDSNVYTRTESGKTEFAGWVETKPGQTRTMTLTYILPFKILSGQGYSLLLQKQSGSKPIQFDGSIGLGQFKTQWLGPDVKSSVFGDSVNFSSNTNTDDFWPFVLSQ